jgi:hypothetical protein
MHHRSDQARESACSFVGAARITLRRYFQTATGGLMSPGTTLFGWPAAAATCAVTLLPFLGRKWTGRGYKYLGNLSRALRLPCVLDHDGGPTALDSASPLELTLLHTAVRECLSFPGRAIPRYCQDWMKKKWSAGMLPVLFLDEIW